MPHSIWPFNLSEQTLQGRLLIFVLALLFPIGLLVLWTGVHQRNYTAQAAKDEALRLTQLTAHNQGERIESAHQMLAVLAQLPIIRSSNYEACDALFGSLLDQYHSYTNIFAVDAEGNTTCSGLPVERPFNVWDLEWYQETIQTGAFTVGRFDLGPLTGLPIVPLGYPVFDEQGEVIGAVGAGLSLDWLNDYIADTSISPDARLIILDRDGRVIASNPNHEWVGQLYNNDKVREAILREGTGTISARGIEGIDRLYGFAALEPSETGAYFVIGYAEDSVLADIIQIERRNLLALALGIAFAIALTWLSSRRIVKPVNRLVEITQQMAAGNLSVRLAPSSPITELNQLANAFNEMASSVENRVETRTAELSQAYERSATLQAISSALSEAITPEQVSEVITAHAFALLRVHRGEITLFREDELEVIGAYSKSPAFAQILPTPLKATGPIKSAVESGGPIWVETLEEYEARFPEFFAEYQAQTGVESFVAVPLKAHDRILGGMVLAFAQPRHFDDETRRFILTLAQYCGQAVERALLFHRAQEVAVLEERQRLARDLHDAVSQMLFSSSLLAESLPRLARQNTDKIWPHLDRLERLNKGALAEMRNLLMELRGIQTVNLSLRELLQQLSQVVMGQTLINVTLTTEGSELTLPPDVQMMFYRIAQEALNNIIKHAQATEVQLRLHHQDSEFVHLSIQDNGDGFDLEQRGKGMGLGIMRERAATINATLEITSEIGEGSKVRLSWSPPT